MSKVTKKNTKKTPEPKKKKKFFKMPSSMTIILFVILFTLILTWGFSGATYGSIESGIQHVEAVGLIGTGNAVISGFQQAAGVIIFLFAIGAFIEVMLRSGTLEAGVSSTLRRFSNKIIWVIPILFVMFALGGTIYGMQEETIGFIPIIVPFLVLAGFDTMTGLLVILLGSTTGFTASTVNPFAIGAAVDAVNDGTGLGDNGKITVGHGMGARWAVWAIIVLIGAVLVTWYAARVRKDNSKSAVADTMAQDKKWAQKQMGTTDIKNAKMTRRQYAGMWVFWLTFAIMITMMIPWDAIISGHKWPEDYGKGWGWLLNGSDFWPGWWYYGELTLLFLGSTIILGLIFGMKMKDISETIWAGAKEMFSVAMIIGIARSVGVILNDSGLGPFMIYHMMRNDGMKNMSPIAFSVTMFFIFLLFAAFIPSTSGLASASMGLVGSTVAGLNGSVENGVWTSQGITTMSTTILAFSMALGIMNMIIPTQAVVMATADKSKVGYGRMMKVVGPYALIMMAISAGLIAGVAAIGV